MCPLHILSCQRPCCPELQDVLTRPWSKEGAQAPLLLFSGLHHQQRCSVYFYFFFNMAFSVLNNLWKLFGNSEHSSSHNAWNLKINGWWFRAWEIRVQNQEGFMVTSEIQKKSPDLKLRLSIPDQNKSWSTREFMCTYMYLQALPLYVCMHACIRVFYHI